MGLMLVSRCRLLSLMLFCLKFNVLPRLEKTKTNARPQRETTRRNALSRLGGPLANLPHPLKQSFLSGQTTFEEVETVAGANGGLGPTMNLNSCAACHVNTAVGGTSLYATPQSCDE
jgi:CxxC motif-containing protein (DUF1111 family)